MMKPHILSNKQISDTQVLLKWLTDKMLNADNRLNQIVAYVAFWAALELQLHFFNIEEEGL